MRVHHLLCSTAWGGAERVACTIHRLALAHGNLSTLDGPPLPELVRGVESECGERLPVVPEGKVSLRWAYRARQRLHTLKPEIVHAHLATPGLSTAAWLIAGDLPLVLTFHLLPDRQRWPNDYLVRLSSGRALSVQGRFQRRHRWVAVSLADQLRLQRRFASEPIELAENVPPLPPLAAAADGDALVYPPGVLRLLSVGRLESQKGLDRMIAALASPSLRVLHWHWVVVGDGSERSALELLVRRFTLEQRVTFVGARPAHTLFAQADLVLCPSRFEGMPLVPLEARFAKVPVVLSRIAAHTEAFGTAPDSFLPDSEAAWPGHLAALLASPSMLKNLAEAQQDRRQQDPHQRLWQDYARIYRELLKP